VAERRLAVVDLGSNSFRLVVFTAHSRGWWKRTDEIYETVRIGEGLGATGRLSEAPIDRALHTIEVFAHFCRASGVRNVRIVATSAIRDAANGPDFVARAEAVSGLPVRVLSIQQEARYGYLAAVNSTTLRNGAVLDIGGGSVQLVRVQGRLGREARSWPLGAVRMTERFLPDVRATKKQIKALRAHVRACLAEAEWLPAAGERGELVGVGGSVRNLAAAAQRTADDAFPGIQGFTLTRGALDDLVDRLARRPASKRALPGIKAGRADVILAAAVVLQTVLDQAGFVSVRATEEGLREGVFFEDYLGPKEPPLFDDVRAASVRNLATQYQDSLEHPERVVRLAAELWDELADAGLHPGDPEERELLRAAALLHDIGMAVDYDDHHKHSKYLVLNAGLPGFEPREVALIALMARYHRKGDPGPDELGPLLHRGDGARLRRAAAVLRVVEQLERARDGTVHDVRVAARNGRVELGLEADDDVTVARWAVLRQGGELFARAFGRELVVG
jgi:exopolyphosphatase / guanosine-5'-triphosphate,3'-diphosphate pyrophosphatase